MNEVKVFLSYLVRNFNIESLTKTEDMVPSGDLILRPRNGVWVKLTDRAETRNIREKDASLSVGAIDARKTA